MRNANLITQINFNPEIQHVEIYPYDPREDINPIMLESTPKLVALARHARWSLTESDRVHVGVSGFAYDPNPEEPRVALLAGGNYKDRLSEDEFDPEHDVDEIPKNCGEQSVMHAAHEARLKRIGMIIVTATTDPTTIRGITEVASATLHPCGVCRNIFKNDSVVDNDTIVLTIGEEEDKLQVMSVRKLLKIYTDFATTGEYKDPRTYDYLDFDWLHTAERYKWRRKRSQTPLGGSENGFNEKQIAAGHQLALQVVHEVLGQ